MMLVYLHSSRYMTGIVYAGMLILTHKSAVLTMSDRQGLSSRSLHVLLMSIQIKALKHTQ